MLGSAVLLAVGAGPAAAVAPTGGGRYDAPKRASLLRPFVAVNRAGTKLSDYDLGGPIACSDGKRRSVGLFAKGERATAIKPDGGFAHRSRSTPFTLTEKLRHPVRVKAGTSFSGTFTTPQQVTITVTSTFSSRRLRCRGSNTLTLDLDGTQAAPNRTSALATGTYRAAGRGIAVSKLSLLAASRELKSLNLSTRVRCRDRSSYRSTFDFAGAYLFQAGDTAGRYSARNTFRLGRAYRAVEKFRMAISFGRSQGQYRVRGRLRVSTLVTRKGRRVTTCSTSRPFTGRFVSGPPNLF